jgi:hypothetical protein
VQTHPPRPGECSAAPPLPTGRFAVSFSGGGEPFRVELDPSGEIRQAGKIAGHVSGACILDASGGVLRSIAADGTVHGPLGERIGALQPRRSMRDDPFNAVHPMDEVLVEEGVAPEIVGVSLDGTVLFGDPEAGTATGTPTVIEGDFARARRTALLLITAVSTFDTPQPANPSQKP